MITTSGESFTYQDHADMALMVYRRFGRDLDAATNAWRRLLQNNSTRGDFIDLLVDAASRLPMNRDVSHILRKEV